MIGWSLSLLGVMIALVSSSGAGSAQSAASSRPANCRHLGLGIGVLRARPRRARPGQVVHVRGKCFRQRWNKGYGLTLRGSFRIGNRSCDLLAGTASQFHVSKTGIGRGRFTVDGRGACIGGATLRGHHRTPPGRYEIIAGCTLCTVGHLQVIRR